MSQTRQKKPHPSELTDRLARLRRRFENKRHTGAQINPAGMDVVLREFDEIMELAREFRNELSALRSSADGRLDALAMSEAAMREAVTAPGSNVIVFPAPERPFSDGHVA